MPSPPGHRPASVLRGSGRGLPDSATRRPRSRARRRPAIRSRSPRAASRTGLEAKPRVSAACVHDRSAKASRAVTRWIVERISDVRTAARSSIAAASSPGSKPSSRDQSPTYGDSGACACIPTRCSIAASGAIASRASSSWRASRARLSARGPSIRPLADRQDQDPAGIPLHLRGAIAGRIRDRRTCCRSRSSAGSAT